MAQRSERNDAFGYRALLAVAIPLAATVGCFAATLFTDRTLLLWYEAASGAASMSAGNVYWAIVCVPVSAMGFLTPLVALATGQRRGRGSVSRRVWTLLWQSVWITLAIVPVLILIGWAGRSLFQSFGHSDVLVDRETQYFRVLLLVAPASMLEAGLTAFYVGRRITRPILKVNLFSASLNVVLDIWFIFGGLGLPAMGVTGAALATAAAMWTKVLIFAIGLIRLKSFHRHAAAAWQPRLDVALEIIGPGMTLGLQQLFRSSLISFVLLAIGAASVSGLAATTAALSLYQLLTIPIIGLATSITVLTGQGMSAGGLPLAHGVTQRGLLLGMAAALLLATVLLIFPHQLLDVSLGGLEPQQAADVRPLAVTLLAFTAVYCLADTASLLMGAGLKGIGKTAVILLATLIPGVISVAIGTLATGRSEHAVIQWWTVLIAWSVLQSLWLLWAVFRQFRPRPGESAAAVTPMPARGGDERAARPAT